MNARLDLLASATNSCDAVPANALLCCARYSPAQDCGPEILGLALDHAERGLKCLIWASIALLSQSGGARR